MRAVLVAFVLLFSLQSRAADLHLFAPHFAPSWAATDDAGGGSGGGAHVEAVVSTGGCLGLFGGMLLTYGGFALPMKWFAPAEWEATGIATVTSHPGALALGFLFGTVAVPLVTVTLFALASAAFGDDFAWAPAYVFSAIGRAIGFLLVFAAPTFVAFSMSAAGMLGEGLSMQLSGGSGGDAPGSRASSAMAAIPLVSASF